MWLIVAYEGGKNPNKIISGSYTRTKVRVLGNFGGWVDPDTREGDNPSKKRRIVKDIIFEEIFIYKYIFLK